MSSDTETNHQSNDPIQIDIALVDAEQPEAKRSQPGIRVKADAVRPYRCNTLICVLENPQNSANVGTVMRNINALGIGKLYVVDGNRVLPPTWQEMRRNRWLMETSGSAIKWTYCRRFETTAECLAYLAKNKVTSMATSPHHVLGKENISLGDGVYMDRKLAIWFGNEVHGVSAEVIAASKACIQIPMFGMIESLNLAVSTGIVMNTVAEKRRANYLAKNPHLTNG